MKGEKQGESCFHFSPPIFRLQFRGFFAGSSSASLCALRASALNPNSETGVARAVGGTGHLPAAPAGSRCHPFLFRSAGLNLRTHSLFCTAAGGADKFPFAFDPLRVTTPPRLGEPGRDHSHFHTEFYVATRKSPRTQQPGRQTQCPQALRTRRRAQTPRTMEGRRPRHQPAQDQARRVSRAVCRPRRRFFCVR